MSLSIYWLIAGALALGLEAFGIPGIGFLFVGLGAIVTGLLVETSILAEGNLPSQVAAFLISTVLFTIALWKRLKSWRMNPSAPRYRNMVGDEAVVATPLIGDAAGTVRWSGTTMQARLQPGTVAELPADARVRITAVDGNVLIVAPKQ